jgi:polyphosphate kinase
MTAGDTKKDATARVAAEVKGFGRSQAQAAASAVREVAQEVAKSDLRDKPERFINRELSWLQFNRRVMEEASNRNHPLLERVRFLSISAGNLDEFFMVRVAGLWGQVRAGIDAVSDDGLTPAQQLASINEAAAHLMAEQQKCWIRLIGELREASIGVLEPDQLTEAELTWLDDHFQSQIFPVLTPLAIDPAHPFPFLPNLGFGMVATMRRARDGRNDQRPDPACRAVSTASSACRPRRRKSRFVTPGADLIGLHHRPPVPRLRGLRHRALFRIIRDSAISKSRKRPRTWCGCSRRR